jgi:transposase InsO family protein
MPWKETRVSEQRMMFITEYEFEEESMAELCRKYGISRKTGYKWFARWRDEGTRGLSDHSRAPLHHPNKVLAWQVEAILAARDRWGWGPKKLRVLLSRERSGIVWPAISTIEQILKDHARVIPRKKRRRVPPQTQPLAHCDGPNAVWCCDFKGHFATADGQRCYPLTITDGFSRYLLRCQGLAQSDYVAVRPIFEWAFREYGLPRAIRSDNGPPFASRAVAGLSRLSLWWIKLGIEPERIEPGKPQQNGRHERMHLTLKQQTASPPASTARKQQQRFDEFRREYNGIRPHEALGMQTPESVYEASPQPYPRREPEVSYPAGWAVRKVQGRGEFYWRGEVPLSEVLRGETIGLEPVDGRYWRTYFGPVWLGVFDDHTRRMLTRAQLRRQPQLLPRDQQDRPSAALQDDPAEG